MDETDATEPAAAAPRPLRLTAPVREQILNQNDGVTFHTHYSGRNFTESRTYTVQDGQITVREEGKGPWGGDRYDKVRTLTDEEAHRALRDYLHEFDTDGVVQVNPSPVRKPKPLVTPDAPDDADDADVFVYDESDDPAIGEITWTKGDLAVVGGLAALAAGVIGWRRYGKPVWEKKVAPKIQRGWAKITRKSPPPPVAAAEEIDDPDTEGERP